MTDEFEVAFDPDAAPISQEISESMAPVHRVMSTPPLFINGDMTLRDVAETLAEENFGSAILLGPRGPEGMVTERDITRALADGANPDTTEAWEVASSELVSLDEEDALLDAAVTMVNNGVRHLPVRRGTEIVGMVSARDILYALTSSLGTRA